MSGRLLSFAAGYLVTYLYVYIFALVDMIQQKSVLAIYELAQDLFGCTALKFPPLLLYGTLGGVGFAAIFQGASYTIMKGWLSKGEAVLLGCLLALIVAGFMLQGAYLTLR